MSTDPPYENTYIGTFIYAMGVIAGRRSAAANDPPIPSGVLLLQQTPLDTAVGDAIPQFGGRGVLLEFKRTEADIPGEYDAKPGKAAFLTILLDYLRRGDHAADWRRAHFVGYGVQEGGNPLTFLPYACVAPGQARRCRHERLRTLDFIDRLLPAAAPDEAVGLPMAQLRQYVAAIAAMHGQAGAEDDATGFLVHVTKDGLVHTVAYHGIGGLQQTLQQTAARSRQDHGAPQAGDGTAPSVTTPQQAKSRKR